MLFIYSSSFEDVKDISGMLISSRPQVSRAAILNCERHWSEKKNPPPPPLLLLSDHAKKIRFWSKSCTCHGGEQPDMVYLGMWEEVEIQRCLFVNRQQLMRKRHSVQGVILLTARGKGWRRNLTNGDVAIEMTDLMLPVSSCIHDKARSFLSLFLCENYV